MGAPLSQELFHGTEATLKPGDTVKPGMDFEHAFATSDASLASQYGSKIYKVAPVDADEAHEYTKAELAKWVGEPTKDAKTVVKSRKGFTVL